MNFLKALPQELSEELSELVRVLTPHTKKLYAVGGAVRDFFLNKNISDLDIEIYDLSLDKFNELMQALGAKEVGKSFQVYKWGSIDIALAREEFKSGTGHKGFVTIPINDEKKGSKRRDFTINSLMINLLTNEVLDFWDGLKDLKKKRVKHICKDSFIEDPLRVLRGVQFASRFGFFIDEDTLNLMKTLPLEELSKTRITWELEKLFNGEFYAHGMVAFYKTNLHKSLFNLNLSWKDLAKVSRALQRYSKDIPSHLKEFYWLYIFAHILNIDMKSLLDKFSFSKKHYKYLLNSYHPKSYLSDYELVKISFEKPLNEWVGIVLEDYSLRAKKLNIYEEKFSGNVSVKDVIKDGFVGKDIKKELLRRIELAAKKDFLGTKKAPKD
ncbi:MAG: CCA tRNA nucleotidyltransferase [Campylobacterales bacterium]|nr:CCA tRNA nucleotidyltransferase [Campylobacterales bacterium]